MRRSKGSPRGRALLVSLGLHVIVLAALFGRASGSIVAAESGGAELHAMSVAIVSIRAPQAQEAEEAGGDLVPLLAKYGSDAPPVSVNPDPPPSSRLAQLLRRLQSAQPVLPKTGLADRKPPPPPEPEASQTDASAAGAPGSGAAAEAGPRGSTGSLWGAIAPCWRSLPRTSTVPVTLEVALDLRGHVSRPPKIIRSADARLDERRLRAEASALAALEACMPRADLQLGGQVYRLDFKPRR